MKNSIKGLKNCFQWIVTAVTCFVMGLLKNDGEKTCLCENRSTIKKEKVLSRVWKAMAVNFVCEMPKARMISEYLIKDKDSEKKKEFGSQHERKKDIRKNKIIYWDEPRIQNRISKYAYFNTG